MFVNLLDCCGLESSSRSKLLLRKIFYIYLDLYFCLSADDVSTRNLCTFINNVYRGLLADHVGQVLYKTKRKVFGPI